jgi:hypothetical protein
MIDIKQSGRRAARCSLSMTLLMFLSLLLGWIPGRAHAQDPFDASVQHDFEFAARQLSVTLAAVGADRYPSTTKPAGSWNTTDESSWTSGSFPAQRWRTSESSDTMPYSHHPYAYALGDPVLNTDPSGKCVFVGVDTLICAGIVIGVYEAVALLAAAGVATYATYDTCQTRHACDQLAADLSRLLPDAQHVEANRSALARGFDYIMKGGDGYVWNDTPPQLNTGNTEGPPPYQPPPGTSVNTPKLGDNALADPFPQAQSCQLPGFELDIPDGPYTSAPWERPVQMPSALRAATNGEIRAAEAKLPTYRKNDPTRGIIIADGKQYPVISGRKGYTEQVPNLVRGWPYRGRAPSLDHAEGHAAAKMHLDGIQNATLVLNHHPCQGEMSCTKWLEHMIPPGATLRVVVPEGLDTTNPSSYDNVFRGVP